MPMDLEAYNVEGAVFTGAAQIKWIVQLAQPEMQRQFVLHGDGKHKLHCGKWILLTMGTHVSSYDKGNSKLVTSYRPLVYLFSKQHESNDACLMLAQVRFLCTVCCVFVHVFQVVFVMYFACIRTVFSL